MCVFVCVFVCNCVFNLVCVWECVHVHVCMQACLGVYVCVCVRVCVHSCMCQGGGVRISYTVKPRLTTTPPSRPPPYSGQFFWSRNEASVILYIKTPDNPGNGHFLRSQEPQLSPVYSVATSRHGTRSLIVN